MRGRESIELGVGRVAMSACELLAQEMDEIEQDLAHRAATDRFSIYRETAVSAGKVVRLCNGLRLAMRRYAVAQSCLHERLDAMKLEHEEDENDELAF